MQVVEGGYGSIQSNADFFLARAEEEDTLYGLEINPVNDVDFKYQSIVKDKSCENITVTFFDTEERGIRSIQNSLTLEGGSVDLKFDFEEENILSGMSLKLKIPLANNITDEIFISWSVSLGIIADIITQHHEHKLKAIATLSSEEIMNVLVIISDIINDYPYQVNLLGIFVNLFFEALIKFDVNLRDACNDAMPMFYNVLNNISNDLLEKMQKCYQDNSSILPQYFDNNIILSQIKEKVIANNILYLKHYQTKSSL